jgi:hypothetical protein
MREENTGGTKKVRRYTSLYIEIVEMRFRSYGLGRPLSDFVENFGFCDGYASPHLREGIFRAVVSAPFSILGG